MQLLYLFFIILYSINGINQATLEEKARAALISYIKNVILNRDNVDGEKIRRAVLDHRKLPDRAAAEQEMLAQAEAFPEIIDELNQQQNWELERCDQTETPYLYYHGRILGLATEIVFNVDGTEVTKVYIEVD